MAGAGAAAAGEGVVGGGKTHRRVFCFDETTPRGAKVRVRLVAGRASQKHTKIRRRRWGTKRNGAPLTTGH